MNILSQIITSAIDRFVGLPSRDDAASTSQAINSAVKNTSKAIQALYPQYGVAVNACKVLSEYAARYEPLKDGLRKNVITTTDWSPFFKKHPIYGWDITNASFHGSKVVSIQQMLLNIFKDVEDPMVMQAMVAQIITKKLVSGTGAGVSLTLGQEIQIPVINNHDQKELVTYILDAKFDLWSQIPAYGFIPKDQGYSPLLIFRSTNTILHEEGTAASLISNFHPKGPGWKLFNDSQSVVTNWLAQKNSEYETKGIVYGYSLGGAVASYFLTYYPNLFHQDINHSSIILDAPGINKQIEADWQKIEAKPSVLLFVNQGDLIPKVGEAFIGRAFEVKTTNLLKGFDCHKALSFFDSEWQMTEISKQLEGQTIARSVLSKLRSFLGKTIYAPVKELLFPTPLLVPILGVSI